MLIPILMSCKKKIEPNIKDTTNTIKGKIPRGGCASMVVQILDSNYYYLGENNWQDILSIDRATYYDHVFTVKNRCDFFDMRIPLDSIFNFEIIEDTIKPTCPTCLQMEEEPATKHSIRIIQ